MSAALLHDGGLVRTRHTRHGVMTYLATDEHVGRSLDTYGEWAQAEVELLSLFLKPGDVVVDVGANVGTHTVALAKAVGASGAVLAFEPQRFVHQVLCANVALNALTWVRTYHAALGRTPGGVVVPDIDYAAPGNFGGLALGDWREGETVPRLTLDGFGLARCALLKVDVEGMEADVLAGAAELLSRARPVVYFENNGPAGAPAACAQLLDRGYSLFWHFSPFFRADNFAGATQNVFGDVVDANTLAVPPALAASLRALQPLSGAEDTAAGALARRAR